MNKLAITKSYANKNHKITKMLGWSLSSIPSESITESTLVLLPKKDSTTFLKRANSCNYDPNNIEKSYAKVLSSNIKLFDEHITASLIFYDNDTCIVSVYLDDKVGDFAPFFILDSTDDLYRHKLYEFDKMWETSSTY